MADDINKKITIDVEVTTDGQQQIQQYKAAFDGLRNTINDLGKPISDLSNNINTLTGSIDKLDKQNQTTSSSSNKLKDNIIDLASTYNSLKGVVDLVKGAFAGLEVEVTAGLSLLVVYGPEILKWVGNMLKGTTTLSALNKTLKDNKLVMDAVNKANADGVQNAQGDLIKLKLLYNASQDHNLSLNERKKIVTQLQQLYPAYFGNISSEIILAGKATKAYNDLSKSILASAKAKAAEDMIVKNTQRELGNSDKIYQAQQQLDAKKKELDAAKKNTKEINEILQTSVNQYGTTSTDNAGEALVSRLQSEYDALKKVHDDIATDSKLLNRQNQKLETVVTKNIEQGGAEVITGIENVINKANTTLKKFKTPKHKKSSESTNSPQTSPNTIGTPKPGQDDADTIPDDLAEANEAYLEDKAKKEQEIAKQTTQKIIDEAAQIKAENQKKEDAARKARNKQIEDEAIQQAQKLSSEAFSILQNSIKQQSDAKIAALEKDKTAELSNSSLTSSQKMAIEAKYQKQEAQVKTKAFKEEQEASIAQAIINGALAITKGSAQMGVLAPLYIPIIIAETAAQVAKIASQKPPAYASGGLHYSSDGKGGVLPGYSRTDNTNAYLRSGEGIVVSEAMRNPWARNLVSAINVGFGGRDFSTTTTGRGFAVGGIFTDGGDANRYYNQPVNDQKNLANTIAYQMVNNFPPVYVDVKDINNQQNILAQTINRVNL